MSFLDWLYSRYPNPSINGQWGLLHILTLVACIALIIGISLIFRKKSSKAKKTIVFTLISIILFFELARRAIGMILMEEYELTNILKLLLPGSWGAISCWTLILAMIVRKKWLYNYASITGLLCAIVFFAYPSAGFNNQYILFENVYSIATHSLLLIVSILFMTLKFTDFNNSKTILPVILSYIFTVGYAFLQIYVLKIESDPLYFMPGNEIFNIVGFEYHWYLIIYVLFICSFTSIFYIIGKKENKN